MSVLGDKLRARSAAGGSSMTIHGLHRAVPSSQDLERILALPRRPPVPGHPPGFEASLRRPGGTMVLKALQGWALWELKTFGRLLGALPVGCGKTGISLLIPTVLGVTKTVLIVPAALKQQLLNRDVPLWSQHWNIPEVIDSGAFSEGTKPQIRLVTSYELQQSKNTDLLEELKPGLIVVDEAHQMSAVQRSRTKRLTRFLRTFPGTKYVPLSGTFMSKSISDSRHHFVFALGTSSPVPLNAWVAEQWASALDPLDQASPPGKLTRLCAENETVGAAFRRRLVETPGVISSSNYRVNASLVFYERKVKVPGSVSKALMRLRDTWTRPDGEELILAIDFYRAASELAAGFYYRRIWPQGESKDLQREWLEARKEWHREVNHKLSRAGTGMDSEELLELAAKSGRWASKTWPRWAAVKSAAKPEKETVWVDEFLARDAIAWAKDGGIVWYLHDALGEKIAELSGWPLIAGGDACYGEWLEILRDKDPTPLVLSQSARGTGTDGLQTLHRRQLFTTASSNGKNWEQVLGRLHREGQEADEVECYVYQHTPEQKAALKKARANARFLEEKTLSSHQKLSYASYAF